MEYDIFKDTADRTKALAALETFEKHDGWKYITKALEANIQKLTDDLKNDDFTELSEVKLKQSEITLLTHLLHLPQDIISEAKGSPEAMEEDIY